MNRQKVVIIGGGISGLSAARYLALAGWEVTVLDKGNFLDNCSFGNAGFVCPSHYIQLATPGIAMQGLKWMWDKQSPFYIQPRLNRALLDWGIHFLKSARQSRVDKNGAALRDIGLLSQYEYENTWRPDIEMDYVHHGMLEVFRTEKGKSDCQQIAAFGQRLGLDIELTDKAGLKRLEPHAQLNAMGAIHYRCDGHLDAGKLMQNLLRNLCTLGVQLKPYAEVQRVDQRGGLIQSVKTAEKTFTADAFVLAAGAWSGDLARQLKLHLPIVGGRGYSFMVPVHGRAQQLLHPGLLVEGRAAFTPLADQIKFGGTMEITRLEARPNMNRVKGIIQAVRTFFPDFKIEFQEIEHKIWSGFRPLSADGMPYIGKSPMLENLVIATGHSQLGISLGAATGLLVSELVRDRPTSINISTFAVDRFK